MVRALPHRRHHTRTYESASALSFRHTHPCPPSLQLNLSNLEVEYNDEEAVPLDSVLGTRVGDICTAKSGAHSIKIKYSGCVGFGCCCMVVGFWTKLFCGGYGDPRKTVPWMSMDPAKHWPLTAAGAIAETAAAPKQQVMAESDPVGAPATPGLEVRVAPAAV